MSTNLHPTEGAAFPILFEDSTLLVINKPAGVSVNRSENEKGETVQDWAEKLPAISYQLSAPKDNDAAKNFCARAGIVHRLDKETSGVLLIAKNPEIMTALQAQFAARTVSKQYKALVHGKIEAQDGVIKVPVGRLPWNRRLFGVVATGREAETAYHRDEVLTHNGNTYTLLSLVPHTGRTHQIRVHCKHIGHPIVADRLYAGKHLLEADRTFCPRLFLHAAALTFTHPVSGMQQSIEAPFPAELAGVLAMLQTP